MVAPPPSLRPPQHCGTQYSLSDFTELWAGLGCREKAGVDEEALVLSRQWGRPAVGASGRGMTQATGPGMPGRGLCARRVLRVSVVGESMWGGTDGPCVPCHVSCVCESMLVSVWHVSRERTFVTGVLCW